MRRIVLALLLACLCVSAQAADSVRPSIPAINWSHPANRNVQLSVVMTGGNGATDLVSRQRGAVTGTWTGGTTSQMGNSLTPPATGHINFVNKPTATLTQFTLWTIITVNSLAATQDIFVASSAGAAGYTIEFTTAGQTNIRANGGSAQFTNCGPVVTGVSYLYIVSLTPSGTACLLKNLGTGTISATTGTTVASGGADSGTMEIGTSALQSNNVTTTYAALLWSFSPMSLGEMVKYSSDPWGPWRVKPLSPALLTGAAANTIIPMPAPGIGGPFSHP